MSGGFHCKGPGSHPVPGSTSWICVGQNDTGTHFSPGPLVSPSQFISTAAPHSHVYPLRDGKRVYLPPTQSHPIATITTRLEKCTYWSAISKVPFRSYHVPHCCTDAPPPPVVKNPKKTDMEARVWKTPMFVTIMGPEVKICSCIRSLRMTVLPRRGNLSHPLSLT